MAEVPSVVQALRACARKSTVQTPLKAPSVGSTSRWPSCVRAGLGMTPGLLELAPKASIEHRAPRREDAGPVRYYVRQEAQDTLSSLRSHTGHRRLGLESSIRRPRARNIVLLTLLPNGGA